MCRKLIAFDFDGTLVDSYAAFTQAVKEFSETRGLPWDMDKMGAGYIDPSKYDLGWGLSLADQPKMFEALSDFLGSEIIHEERFMPALFDGVVETLEKLNGAYDMVIVTARDRYTLGVVLDHYDLRRFFPAFRSLCCARERGYSIKPAPDALHCLLKDTSHAAEDVVVVGDTSADIRMAHALGAKSIGALWGVHPQAKLADHNPTLMLEKITDLPDGVRGVFSR